MNAQQFLTGAHSRFGSRRNYTIIAVLLLVLAGYTVVTGSKPQRCGADQISIGVHRVVIGTSLGDVLVRDTPDMTANALAKLNHMSVDDSFGPDLSGTTCITVDKATLKGGAKNSGGAEGN